MPVSYRSMNNGLKGCLLICGICAVAIVLSVVASVVANVQEVTGIDQAVETVKATPGPGGGILAFIMNPLVLGLGIVALVTAWIWGKFNS